MNVTVEKLPKCLTEVAASFPAEDVNSKKTSIISKFSQEAQIRGFRPGKAPQRVIIKRYGKEIEGELEYQLLNQVITHTVREEKINFLDVQDRKVSHEESGEISIQLTLIVAPEFELGEYKGIEVSVPEMEVTEELVEGEILRIRQQQAQYPVKEEGGVEDGDIVVISYTSTCDGQDTADLFEESITPYDNKEGYWIKVGEDHFLPEFSKQLIGMVTGSEKAIEHTFADDFSIEAVRGKTFTYTVTATEIKTEELPAMEEVIKMISGEEGTIEDLHEKIRGYIESQQEKSINERKQQTILDHLSGGVEFDLPEEYLNAQTQNEADRLVSQGMQYGMDEETVVKMEEEIISTAKTSAAQSLKNHFILQKIAELEEIKVEEQEVMQRVFMEAYQSGQDPQKALKDLKQSGDDHKYHQSILMDKVVDFLVGEANVTIETAEEETND